MALRHHIQESLYAQGARRVSAHDGVAPYVLPSHIVRQVGIIEAGKRATRAALVGITAVAALQFIGDAIDRSPTMRHMERIEQDRAERDIPGAEPYKPAEKQAGTVEQADVSSRGRVVAHTDR